jgi:dinuclear metal center YbgI/SA1388 family protein
VAHLKPVVSFLDGLLKTVKIEDSSHNGLQVENSGRVRRVCAGVDASLEFFEAARKRRADLLICHHGLSWGDSLKRLTELNYRRVAALIQNDMALYASHLPLDAHPQLGNNILLARALKLRRLTRFGLYHGVKIGYAGELSRTMTIKEFAARVAVVLGQAPTIMDFGSAHIRHVGVVSGGAALELEEAQNRGLDVLVTGEVCLQGYTLARDLKINAIFGGHYATERFGVKALADAVSRRFRLPSELIDLHIQQ